jgi:hypothetical protein
MACRTQFNAIPTALYYSSHAGLFGGPPYCICADAEADRPMFTFPMPVLVAIIIAPAAIQIMDRQWEKCREQCHLVPSRGPREPACRHGSPWERLRP